MLSKKTNNADVIGYCCMRFPVSDLKKSVDFYCNVLGYELNSADFQFGEAHVALKNGNGPGIFLMETKKEDITQLKFVFPRSFFITNSTGHVTMVEILTNDLLALHERIKQAGADIDKEPVFTDDFGYFTFYDPDGHYIRAVEERGVYFDLKQRMSSTLKRDLTEHENQLLRGLCEKLVLNSKSFLAPSSRKFEVIERVSQNNEAYNRNGAEGRGRNLIY
ncbi:VOC family protein [Lederbergia citri]|uniref:VOC family protein n=1 Tax=Lederbergia citri TaxID=2833580 RepID=A0A942YI75_9BACI|nr:VOC family protein [Lederbergia citri]MBS4196639.1 VOC family protein [Lederbergia citri]